MADPNNPSGALPGDPRYGLSEAELKEYYRKKQPSWIITSTVTPDGKALRQKHMDAHVDFLRANRDVIRFSGPLLEPDGDPDGFLTIIDAPDRAAAEAWIAEEPFYAAGAFEPAEFLRWSSSMAMRQADYPRTEGWQYFAIFARDVDDPAESKRRRDAVAEAHHKFQASVMDRYVARGPYFNDDGSRMTGSFMIMEYPDRKACDDFWAAEPLNYGGVFEDVRIHRWRFGKSLG